MRKNNKINFQVLSTDYDHEKATASFLAYCKKSPYYAPTIKQRYPQLIKKYKEELSQEVPLRCDILIIEDDIICILKYFYLLERYIEKYTTPIIQKVIACTKAASVHSILDNLSHSNNSHAKPKLIILDFDLQEEKDSANSIVDIANRIEKFNWHPEYLAVTGFKSIKGDFKAFEDKLRNRHHRTYEKERLDDHDLMLDNLEFLLNRSEHEQKMSSKLDLLYKKGDEAYTKLEREFGKKATKSTIHFLDILEKGIKNSCMKMEKLNADSHKIPNMRGNFYNATTLAQQISKRHELINKLLVLSYHTSHLFYRWEFFEYQVCHHRFSSKHLNCPKMFLFKKEKRIK
tara:strand:+ start:743092 stop:744126 length:1035 start_codon:yes stop_codon:yes gene_type:complete